MVKDMENKKTEKAEILHRLAGGIASLEFYKDRGHIVAFRSKGAIVFFEWDYFKKIFEEFELIIKARTSDSVIKCPYCGYTSKSRHGLKTHIGMVHVTKKEGDQ